jgi:heparanase 1
MLRVGGGDEHNVVMEVKGGECAARGAPSHYCLTMPRWHEILGFARKTGVRLVWGLGAQRRANATAAMDMTNVRDFLRYTASLGPDVLASTRPVAHNATAAAGTGGLLGFELGNELDGGDYTSGYRVEPETLAEDYRTLRAMIDGLFFSAFKTRTRRRGRPPLLVGPAMHGQVRWARAFLVALGRGVLDVFSFHDYTGIGLDPRLAEKVVDPAFLEAYWEQAAPVVALANALQPGADVIVGETSAAWHSGRCGVTDRVRGSMWYADALGRLARGGVQAVARHSFNGGCYAMVGPSEGGFAPRPDYWIASVFSRLMGPNVLDLRALSLADVGAADVGAADVGDPATRSRLLTYAHTSRRFSEGPGSGATLLLVNLSGTTAFDVSLSDYPGLMAPRYEHHFDGGPEGLESETLMLNGEPMRMQAGGALPALPGRLSNDPTTPVRVQPHSIVFVELPKATVY